VSTLLCLCLAVLLVDIRMVSLCDVLLKHLIYSIIGRVRRLSEWSFVLGIEHLSYVSLDG